MAKKKEINVQEEGTNRLLSMLFQDQTESLMLRQLKSDPMLRVLSRMGFQVPRETWAEIIDRVADSVDIRTKPVLVDRAKWVGMSDRGIAQFVEATEELEVSKAVMGGGVEEHTALFNLLANGLVSKEEGASIRARIIEKNGAVPLNAFNAMYKHYLGVEDLTPSDE